MLRLLHLDDKEQYLELLNTFRPVNINMTDEEFETMYIKVFRTNEIYVYEHEEILVGTVSLIIEQKFINNCAVYAHIEDVVINPAYRGKGIGQKMIDTVITHCREAGIYKIILNCNEELKKFYSKNDFNDVGIQMAIKLE